MPYALATLNLPEKKEELDSGDYNITLDRCLAEIRWPQKEALQGRLVDGRYHGLGIGCFIEGGAAGPRENARMVVDPGGFISVFVGSTSIGQGLETVCIQIAADALGVTMDRIRFYHGSTTYLKEGFGSFHSRSVVMGGSAILDAANNLKTAIRDAAAARLGCAAVRRDARRGTRGLARRPVRQSPSRSWPNPASRWKAPSRTITIPMPTVRPRRTLPWTRARAAWNCSNT